MWFAISGAFDFLQAYNAAITALATVAIGVRALSSLTLAP
jgi:hypothetical protein